MLRSPSRTSSSRPSISDSTSTASDAPPRDDGGPSGPIAARSSWLRWAGPLLALVLFAIAIAALHRQLSAYRYRDIVNGVRQLHAAQLVAAAALTALAYLVLAGYDAVALRYVGRPLPPRRIAFGAFIAYAFSQNLGFPVLTGGSVRYRFWSAWGLSTAEIAQAVSFAGGTFVLGMIAVGGAVFLVEPEATRLLALPFSLRPLGAVALLLVAAYLAWSLVRREPIRIRGWQFPVPSPGIALVQLGTAAVDWAVAASVLYVLLPPGHGLGYPSFLAVFLLAQFAGLISSVPGGLGVFETLIVLLLAPHVPATAALGSLLAYRAIYYFLPFALAVCLLAAHELHRHRERVLVAAQAAGRWVPSVVPQVLSVAVFVAGVLLLVSGALPAERGRLRALDELFPLAVIELSHFAASLAGAGLVVLAWAIRRRLDAAHGLAVALLAVGLVASLLRGLAWEQALVLGIALAAVVPARSHFYRRAALTNEPLGPGWIVALLVVVGATIWLGFFSYKHVQYEDELWWRFTLQGDAPRFLRASVGVIVALLVFGLLRLLRHAPASPPRPTEAEVERAQAVAARSHELFANLALLGDKALLWSERGDGFLMYGVERRSWVALGDPVGEASTRTELAWRFREEADRHGGWTVFYEVGTANLPLYIDLGLTLLKLGEEARVPLRDFSLEGSRRKALRQVRRGMERQGVTFEVVGPEAVPALLPELRRVSDAWLAEKRTREKGFSLGYFDESYLARFPIALLRLEGTIVAFANLLRGGDRTALSLDLMRYVPAAPHGTMTHLFVEMMLYGRDEGYEAFSLGMAPLSGFDTRTLAPLWSRVGALVYKHGEHFYNFRGLRHYKEKFDPVWEPRYLASPGGLVLPRVLTNVATLISGGLRGVVTR